jgi:hypothetical protein
VDIDEEQTTVPNAPSANAINPSPQRRLRPKQKGEIKKLIHAGLDGELWRTPMRMNLSSRLIFTAIGVSLPIAAHRADMNETHGDP